MQCEVWGLECEGSSEKWEVWSVKCGVWSVECEVSVWSAKSAVWSVKCEVWSVKFEVWSAKSAVWSVECGVWSLKFGVRRVQCEVWSVKTLLRLSLKKSNGCRGKDTVGTGCLWTIGHLCLGNFRRRLARVYVKMFFLFGMEWYGWAWLQVAPLGANSNKEAFRLTMPPSSAGPKLAHWSTEIWPKEAFWLEDTRRYYNIL